MRKEEIPKFGKIPWSKLTSILSEVGWILEFDTKDVKRYRRGLQQLVLARAGRKKWKVEYFVNGRLYDSAGITDEEFAKVLASEIGILRGLRP